MNKDDIDTLKAIFTREISRRTIYKASKPESWQKGPEGQRYGLLTDQLESINDVINDLEKYIEIETLCGIQ